MAGLANKIKSSAKALMQKGAAHIFIGNFLTKFIAFFSSIFLVRVLSPKDFGILSYYDNLLGYFQVFMGMGLCYAILRFAVLGKDSEEKYSYYRYSLDTGSKFNILLVLAAVIITLFYNHKPSYEPYRWLLVVMVAIVPAKFFVESSLNCQRAMFDSKRYAVNSFMVSTVWVAARFLGGWSLGIIGAVLFSLVAEAALSLSASRSTRRIYFSGVAYKPPAEDTRREINVFALQYMFTNSLWAIFMLNDIFLLGRLIDDPTAVAQYKTAYVLPANLAIIASSIGVFVGPYFTKREHDGDLPWVRRNWAKCMAATGGLIAGAALVLFIFAKPVILLLYEEEYLGSVPIMRILLIAAVFNSGLRYITAHILSSMGKVKYNMIISALGMIMQITLDIIVIPKYKAIGVACVSVGVYAFMAISLAAVFIYNYFIKDRRKATEQ